MYLWKIATIKLTGKFKWSTLYVNCLCKTKHFTISRRLIFRDAPSPCSAHFHLCIMVAAKIQSGTLVLLPIYILGILRDIWQAKTPVHHSFIVMHTSMLKKGVIGISDFELRLELFIKAPFIRLQLMTPLRHTFGEMRRVLF